MLLSWVFVSVFVFSCPLLSRRSLFVSSRILLRCRATSLYNALICRLRALDSITENGRPMRMRRVTCFSACIHVSLCSLFFCRLPVAVHGSEEGARGARLCVLLCHDMSKKRATQSAASEAARVCVCACLCGGKALVLLVYQLPSSVAFAYISASVKLASFRMRAAPLLVSGENGASLSICAYPRAFVQKVAHNIDGRKVPLHMKTLEAEIRKTKTPLQCAISATRMSPSTLHLFLFSHPCSR